MGWVFLAVALAVPGFIFYTWWNHQKNAEIGVKIRNRLPDGKFFSDGASGAKLSNPILSQNAAAPASTMTASVAQVPAKTLPMAPAVPVSSMQPSSAPFQPPPNAVAQIPVKPSPATPPTSKIPIAPTQAAILSSSGPEVSSVGAASTDTVLSLRDPTLSPYDIFKLQQAELEKNMKQEEVHEAAAPARRVRREPPIENSISLQGIIATPDEGNKAIINGEMVSQGDMVGPVKILKITSQAVYFQYKKKKFVKTVSR